MGYAHVHHNGVRYLAQNPRQSRPTRTEAANAVEAQTSGVRRALPMRQLPAAYVPSGPSVKLAALVNVPIVLTDIGRESIGGRFNKPMRDFTFQRVPDYQTNADETYRCITGSGPLLEQLHNMAEKDSLPLLIVIVARAASNARYQDYYTFGDPAEFMDNADVTITTEDLE